jgi:hypothetical protein
MGKGTWDSVTLDLGFLSWWLSFGWLEFGWRGRWPYDGSIWWLTRRIYSEVAS